MHHTPGGGGYFGHFHTGTCRLGAQTQPCLKFFVTRNTTQSKILIGMKNTPCLKQRHENIKNWLILGGRHTATKKDTNLIPDTFYAKLSATKS